MSNNLVFLFGAGASNDAGQVIPCNPPLGYELYDQLAECLPKEWGPGSKLSHYGPGLRQNFEETMFKEVCRWNPSLTVLEWQQKMALYFSRFTLDSTGENRYSRLLSFLNDTGKLRGSIFASLNYDCLFEQAGYNMGLQVDYSSDQVGASVIRVLKIHGSCNFITVDIEEKRTYLTNPNSSTECEMNCLLPQDVEKELRSKYKGPLSSYYPVMSLYSFGKNSLVAGRRIQEIRESWVQMALGASKVVVIGVSYNEDDKHVVDPLKETAASNLYYIGDKNSFEKWKKANSHFELLATTFEEGFEKLTTALVN